MRASVAFETLLNRHGLGLEGGEWGGRASIFSISLTVGCNLVTKLGLSLDQRRQRGAFRPYRRPARIVMQTSFNPATTFGDGGFETNHLWMRLAQALALAAARSPSARACASMAECSIASAISSAGVRGAGRRGRRGSRGRTGQTRDVHCTSTRAAGEISFHDRPRRKTGSILGDRETAGIRVDVGLQLLQFIR